jgi:hypothetical protein
MTRYPNTNIMHKPKETQCKMNIVNPACTVASPFNRFAVNAIPFRPGIQAIVATKERKEARPRRVMPILSHFAPDLKRNGDHNANGSARTKATAATASIYGKKTLCRTSSPSCSSSKSLVVLFPEVVFEARLARAGQEM